MHGKSLSTLKCLSTVVKATMSEIGNLTINVNKLYKIFQKIEWKNDVYNKLNKKIIQHLWKL